MSNTAKRVGSAPIFLPKSPAIFFCLVFTRFELLGGLDDAVRYWDEIVEPVVIPYLQNLGPNFILQNENARPHRARIITEYLQNLEVERMEWPAVSPDLNPIEHLWGQLGRAVRARVTNRTMLADLPQILIEEWDAIPQQNVARLVARLVTSMRRRCQAVVAAYGSSTCY